MLCPGSAEPGHLMATLFFPEPNEWQLFPFPDCENSSQRLNWPWPLLWVCQRPLPPGCGYIKQCHWISCKPRSAACWSDVNCRLPCGLWKPPARKTSAKNAAPHPPAPRLTAVDQEMRCSPWDLPGAFAVERMVWVGGGSMGELGIMCILDWVWYCCY